MANNASANQEHVDIEHKLELERIRQQHPSNWPSTFLLGISLRFEDSDPAPDTRDMAATHLGYLGILPDCIHWWIKNNIKALRF